MTRRRTKAHTHTQSERRTQSATRARRVTWPHKPGHSEVPAADDLAGAEGEGKRALLRAGIEEASHWELNHCLPQPVRHHHVWEGHEKRESGGSGYEIEGTRARGTEGG